MRSSTVTKVGARDRLNELLAGDVAGAPLASDCSSLPNSTFPSGSSFLPGSSFWTGSSFLSEMGERDPVEG